MSSDPVNLKLDLQIACSQLKRLTFVSGPLKRTYNEMRLPLYLNEPGCWLSAPYGQGKTIAIDYCAASLRSEVPGLPVFVINEQVLPGNELKSFFIRALLESKHQKTSSSQADVLRNRLARYWAELSDSSPLGCVVLLLDEGQAIREVDEHLLKDLGNQIVQEGGALQVFTFGESPKLDTLISGRKFKNTSGSVDRVFGGHKLKLHDYDSLSDWETLFAEMDDQPFARLSDMTVRDRFFGHLDISGYQLKSEVKRFYKALSDVKKKRTGTINLRRIFLGIRTAILMCAINTIDSQVVAFDGISQKQWEMSLVYGCNCAIE